jgi:hypothetical protein
MADSNIMYCEEIQTKESACEWLSFTYIGETAYNNIPLDRMLSTTVKTF